ncbi:MAG: oligosaccharide flippase family protein [Anaerolineae bacterium]|nr:oligosaccharide flippase family protein [Anaerolineae bacterium]
MNEPGERQRVATRVAKNTAAQMVAMGSTIVSKLLITIVIARVFGPTAVGDFAFVITFSTLFTFLATAGLPLTLIREVATHREQAHRYAGASLGIAGLAGLGTVPLMWAIAALMGKSADIQLAVVLAGIALAGDALAQVLIGVFNGFERMELAAAVTITQELAFLVVGTLVLLLRLPFVWVYAVYVPSRLSGALVGLVIYRRLFAQPVRLHFEWPFVKMLVRTALPYAANMALGPVYLRIDVVMLSFFQGSAEVGLYEVATSIFYRFNVFARMLNNALMPLMAREFESQAERIRTYIRAAARYQFVLGIPLTAWCVLLADWLIALLFGPSFTGSVLVFRLMTPLIVIRFFSNTLATALTAVNRQAARSTIIAAMALLNIGMNLYALPRYSYLGAAVTSIITEVLFYSIVYLVLRRDVPRPLGARFMLKPIAAGAGMVAALLLLRAVLPTSWALPEGNTAGGSLALSWLASALPLLVLMCFTGLIYLGMLFALGTFNQEERRWMLRVLQLYRLLPVQARNAVLAPRPPETEKEQ